MDGYDDVLTEEYISEEYDGFQAMQDFVSEMKRKLGLGAELRRRLEQEGRCVEVVDVDECVGVLPEVPLGPMTLE